MDQYEPDLVDVRNDNYIVKMFRFCGTILSFLVLVIIIVWTVNLYKRDIDDLPFISAFEGDIRIEPKDLGGREIEFKGLSVNNVLDSDGDDNSLSEVTLAPLDRGLLLSEESPALMVTKSSKLNKDIVASSITSALETLLGINKQANKIVEEDIELHIASYSTADKANAHWFVLQQLNSDLLENYNHQVVQVYDNNMDFFRLRIVGFSSLELAQDMCDRLMDRGEKCVPALAKK
jgi:hypothetical protein